jgi:DNA-directed RNA polymerase specialized sigma24 family protein
MAAAAYLVLHNRCQAEEVVVETLAHAWRSPDEAGTVPQIRAWLLGHATTRALVTQRRSRAVDAVLPGSSLASPGPGRPGRDLPNVLRAIAELPPRQRGVIALRHLAGLDPAETAGALGMSQEALDSELHAALRRLVTLLPDEAQNPRAEAVLPWAASVVDASRGRLEERLSAALGRLPELLPFGVHADQVRHLLAAPPPSRKVDRRSVVLALLAVAMAAIVLIVILGGGRIGSGGGGGANGATPGPSALVPPSQPAASAAGLADGAVPITLASCDIAPADLPLAFGGWATAETIHLPHAGIGAGQPVYALVTQGLARMVTGRSSGGWIDPPPKSRLSCLYDPATGARSLASVPFNWQPPAIVDGCTASPEDSFAGYHEVGGPRAWFVLPESGTLWSVRGENRIVFRLAPDLGPADTLSGWAAPLTGRERVAASIDPGHPELSAPAASLPVSAANYHVLTVRFAVPGCWVLNVAIDGEVVGSAVVRTGTLQPYRLER